jgi:hypothetical protein
MAYNRALGLNQKGPLMLTKDQAAAAADALAQPGQKAAVELAEKELEHRKKRKWLLVALIVIIVTGLMRYMT